MASRPGRRLTFSPNQSVSRRLAGAENVKRRRLDLGVHPLAGLAAGAGVDLAPSGALDCVDQRLGDPPTHPLDDQRGRVERGLEVANERRHVVLAGEVLDTATDDDAAVGEERRRRGCVDERADLLGLLVEDDLVDQQGAVAVADEVVDQDGERGADEDLVGALDQVHRCHAAAWLIAAMVSATRRAALTSWARRMRQPLAIPSACAALVPAERSVTSVPSSSPMNRLFDADRNTG